MLPMDKETLRLPDYMDDPSDGFWTVGLVVFKRVYWWQPSRSEMMTLGMWYDGWLIVGFTCQKCKGLFFGSEPAHLMHSPCFHHFSENGVFS